MFICVNFFSRGARSRFGKTDLRPDSEGVDEENDIFITYVKMEGGGKMEVLAVPLHSNIRSETEKAKIAS